MSITATRAPRFAPPAEPTRKATRRRTATGHGFSVVGRAERPVLRIVADRFPAVERVPAVEVVETPLRRVSLDDFFAAEYDGDEQRLEVVRPRPSSVRLTRRGRLALLVASITALLGLGFLAASGSAANDHPAHTRVVTVAPGQTLWDLSARAAGGGDVRSMMSYIVSLNHLGSTVLQAGQHLQVPQ
jgi:LysM domain